MSSKISIVIPSFNQGKFIEQTIVSVLDQHYPNLELIVIDGGSKDETVGILKKYEKHFAYWESVPDKGQTDAINKGFAHCTGDIFNWLNSDDYYHPDALKQVSESFKNPKVKVVCGTEIAFQNDNPAETIFHAGTVIKENVFETIRVGIYTQPSSFMRMEEARKCFPLFNNLRYVMDRELWWKFLMRNGQEDVQKINAQITNFRLHSSSKSVGEQAHFETEFDMLKRSLFNQLNAPDCFFTLLKDEGKELEIEWPVKPDQRMQILCAFASSFAQSAYVKNDLELTRQFMSFIKKNRTTKMSPQEKKMWMMSCIIPHNVVRSIKAYRNRS